MPSSRGLLVKVAPCAVVLFFRAPLAGLDLVEVGL